MADDIEARAWWCGLSPEEQDTERAKTLASVRVGDAGRSSPVKEAFVRIRAKHASEAAANQGV